MVVRYIVDMPITAMPCIDADAHRAVGAYCTASIYSGPAGDHSDLCIAVNCVVSPLREVANSIWRVSRDSRAKAIDEVAEWIFHQSSDESWLDASMARKRLHEAASNLRAGKVSEF